MDDRLFLDSPAWLDILFEGMDGRITICLEKNSQLYQEYKERTRGIYEKYPEFAVVIEGAEEHTPMILNEEAVENLSKLVRTEFDIMEMYQRVLYFLGVRDGMRFAEWIQQLEKI